MISCAELWQEIDRVWDDCLVRHNGKQSRDFFAEFYSHPVWCLNSIFSTVDPISLRNRNCLVQTIESLSIASLADMGGGYGVFLKMLRQKLPHLSLTLCEPYITDDTAREMADQMIDVSSEMPMQADAYLFIDVLEHLVDPLSYLDGLVKVARRGSYFIFGNCFSPVIKCHLPSTFYLRDTFRLAAALMGLKFLRSVRGAKYMEVYQLRSRPRLGPELIQAIARFLSLLFYPLVPLRLLAGKLKKWSGKST